MKFPPEPNYAGIVVLLFAVMISFVVIADTAVNVFTDRVATEGEARVVAGVVGAAIGVVSTYVGGHWHARERTRSLDKEGRRVRGLEEGGVLEEQVGGDQQRGGEGTGGTEPDGEESGQEP